MRKMEISLAITLLLVFAGPAGLSAQGDMSVLGGTGGGVHGFIGFEHELGRPLLGDLFLRESLGGSYIESQFVISPDILFGWQLLDLDFLRCDVNISAGSHIVAGTIFSFLPYASAGAEISSYFVFVGYEFVVAIPDFSAIQPQFLHQISAGLRFKIGSLGIGPSVKASNSGKKASPAAKASTKAKAPLITFTSPKIIAGQKFTTSASTIIISGQLSNPSAAKEVWVQGVNAKLTGKGTFSATVKLAVGGNTIIVTVVDKKNGKETVSIAIERTKK